MVTSSIKAGNFLEQEIAQDIKGKGIKKVVTRFIISPTQHTHIGNAKEAWVNFSIAQKFHGYTILRFDDINWLQGEADCIKAISDDIRWLGFKWKSASLVSNYFDLIWQNAVYLIRQGKAYVDDCDRQQAEATRGTPYEPGAESECRSRSAEENLRLFQRMKEGKFKNGEKVLRAKTSMSHPNVNMRDPVLYVVSNQKHAKLGNKWCIYPTAEFAMPLCDIAEGVTHALCTLEWEEKHSFYEWVVSSCAIDGSTSVQMEYARLNLKSVELNNDFFEELVQKGVVEDFDDPRLATLSGLKRRGFSASGVRDFCLRTGVSKSNSTMSPAILDACVATDLMKISPKVVAVVSPLLVNLTNYSIIKTEKVDVPLNSAIESKKHTITFSHQLVIETSDFSEKPSSKFTGLTPDGYVELLGGSIIHCDEVVRDKEGKITALNCSLVTDATKRGIQPKGSIHWLSPKHSTPVIVRTFKDILREGEVYEAGMLDRIVNPNSVEEHQSYLDPYAAKLSGNLEFVRIGYFIADTSLSKKGSAVYLQTTPMI